MDRMVQLAGTLAETLNRGSPEITLRPTDRNPGHAPGIYGLASSATMFGASALDHCSRGNRLLAAPHARLAFECGITAQWMVSTKGTVEAMSNEYSRLRVALRDTIRSGSILAAAADQVSGINTEPLVTEETARARHFVQRCTFFAGGHDLYMLYRLISGQCHPGVDLIDEWIAESDFGPLGIAFRDSPKADDDDSTSVTAPIAVLGMLWACSAFEHLRPDPVFAEVLADIADEMGTRADLVRK